MVKPKTLELSSVINRFCEIYNEGVKQLFISRWEHSQPEKNKVREGMRNIGTQRHSMEKIQQTEVKLLSARDDFIKTKRE